MGPENGEQNVKVNGERKRNKEKGKSKGKMIGEKEIGQERGKRKMKGHTVKVKR